MSNQRPTARFYAVDTSFNQPGGSGLARFGPFYKPGTNALHLNLTALALGRPQTVGAYVYDAQLRVLKFPGVLHVESPARGSLTMLAPAGITNNSTIILNDHVNTGTFRLRKSGANPGTNIDVDITAATTGAQVATALAAAIATWTNGLGGQTSGFQVRAVGADLSLVQANVAKMDNPLRSWFAITNGNLGNEAITGTAVGVGATNVVGMVGGKPRIPGVTAWFAPHHRMVTDCTYFGPLKDDG